MKIYSGVHGLRAILKLICIWIFSVHDYYHTILLTFYHKHRPNFLSRTTSDFFFQYSQLQIYYHRKKTYKFSPHSLHIIMPMSNKIYIFQIRFLPEIIITKKKILLPENKFIVHLFQSMERERDITQLIGMYTRTQSLRKKI